MKTALLSAMLLSGCAAQPYTSPTYPQAVDTRSECVEHIAKVLAFVQVMEPILDQCLAGNSQKCGLFAVTQDRLQPQHDSKAASRCFEDYQAPLGLALAVNDQLPRFTRKLQRYNKKMGN